LQDPAAREAAAHRARAEDPRRDRSGPNVRRPLRDAPGAPRRSGAGAPAFVPRSGRARGGRAAARPPGAARRRPGGSRRGPAQPRAAARAGERWRGGRASKRRTPAAAQPQQRGPTRAPHGAGHRGFSPDLAGGRSASGRPPWRARGRSPGARRTRRPRASLLAGAGLPTPACRAVRRGLREHRAARRRPPERFAVDPGRTRRHRRRSARLRPRAAAALVRRRPPRAARSRHRRPERRRDRWETGARRGGAAPGGALVGRAKRPLLGEGPDASGNPPRAQFSDPLHRLIFFARSPKAAKQASCQRTGSDRRAPIRIARCHAGRYLVVWMPKRSAETVERLLSDVEWALEKGLGARDLVPMLERLLRRAASGSDAWVFASRQLAEQVVQRDPWRAAGLARRVLASCDDDRSWAVLALALTLMGHYRAAARAYRRALALAPDCPNHLHNLGHLLDVALDRPRSAL